jgi:hypothetical protein
MHRRMILQAGAVAAGTLASPILFRAAAAAGRPILDEAAPLSGTLVAWVLVTLDEGAKIRLFHCDRSSAPVAEAPAVRLSRQELSDASGSPAAEQLRRACDEAQRLALGAAARCWGVPPVECVMERGRIVHRGLAAGSAMPSAPS